MRLALVFALSSLLAGGCLSMVIPEHHPDGGTQGMTPSDGSAAADLAQPPDTDGGLTQGDGGGSARAFGAPCATNADCASGDCAQVNMGLYCSQKCTNLGQPDPTCPNNGQCNNNGDCKP